MSYEPLPESPIYFEDSVLASLSGEEKGALLLKILAPEVVQKILSRLAPDRGARLRTLMDKVQLGPESQKILADLLEELRSAGTAKKSPASNGPATLSMNSAPSLEKRAEAFSNHQPISSAPVASAPPENDPDSLQSLTALSAERIALVLEGETARTASILLNILEGPKAAEVFRRLPEGLRADVSVQFSTQNMPPVEVVRRIAQALVQKSQRLQDKPAFPEGIVRFRKMADMLRLLDKPQRVQVLTALEAKTPDIANQVKSLMYRFDDLLRIDNRSLQKILKEVDTKELALALRDASDPIKDKLLANLSKRAQENLAEEIDQARSASKEEMEKAQMSLVLIVQRLDLAGELVMTE